MVRVLGLGSRPAVADEESARAEDLVDLAGELQVHTSGAGFELADERAADEEPFAEFGLAHARAFARYAQFRAQEGAG